MTTVQQRILMALPGRFKGPFLRLLKSRLPEAHRRLYGNAALTYAPLMNMQLVAGDLISDSIVTSGVYDAELTTKLAGSPPLRGLFVDVGANLGYFSLLWAASAPENRVIAFEAAPRNIDLLTRNVARNGLGDRITIVPRAAGRVNEVLTFDIGPEAQTGWGGISLGASASTIQVQAVRLDDTLDEPVRFLKIDVEGADPWVLEGCERLLRERRIDEIWFEENKERAALLGIPLQAGARYLERVGYTCEPLNDPSDGMVNWRAFPAGVPPRPAS